MDKAIDELKYTLSQAEEYIGSATHYSEELQAHSEALREDIEIVEKFQQAEKTVDKEAVDVVRIARRMRRDLDKLLFPLQRAAKAAELKLQKERLEIEKQANRTAQATLEKTPSTDKKVSALKLPNLKIPIFKGEVEQWRGFKQIVTDIIEAEADISPTRMWLLLRDHLGGKAFELVQELPTAPETFRVAMEILEQSYGSVNKAVTHLYHRLQVLPASTMSNENLRMTHAKLDGMLRSLETLGEDVDTNRFLRTVVISKFPREVFLILHVTDEMDLKSFRQKMAGYIASNENSIELVPEKQPVPFNKDQNKNRFRQRPTNETSAPSASNGSKEASAEKSEEAPVVKKPKPAKCTFCAASHYSDQCDVYKTLEQRKQKLGDRCQTCFRMPHPNKNCARKIKCVHCDETTHNRALCPKKLAETEKSCQIKDVAVSASTKQDNTSLQITEEVVNAGYVTMMLTAYSSPTKETGEEVRAILDTASRRTLIRRSLVQRLGVKENTDALVQVYGVTNMSSGKKPNTTCKLYLKPEGHNPLLIDAVIMDDIIDEIEAPSVEEFRIRYPQFSELRIPAEGNGKIVELLIGTRTLVPILTLHNSIPISHSLQLLSTKFGWVILGGYDDNVDREESSVAAMVVQAYDPVKLMCELDVVGLKGLENTKTEEEAIALEKFYETLEFKDQRYEVGLPYRYDPPDLEDNFGLAWGRLRSLYKKLISSSQLLESYNKQMTEQEEMGIIEKVNNPFATEMKTHYIAHQVVIRMDKTTPVRIVLDASAHHAGKRSLNDNVLKGANWVDDMPALLMRFRKNETAVTADVSKAFHQLSIRKEDRDVCRFLWLKDVSKPPSKDNIQVYRFRRVAFGIASSPFLLYATIKYHLRKNPHEYTHVLENDFYADNLVASLPSSTDLPSFYEKVKRTFGTMSMNLTKWASNSRQLQQIIPAADQNQETKQMVLGLGWRTDNDTMSIHVKQNVFSVQTKLTKRRLMKEAATIFDPLGWAMPIVLTARIFIRKIWQQNYDWDDALPETLVVKWQQIRAELLNIEKIQLPRRMFTCPVLNETKNWELHIFSDASIEACGLVAFIKSGNQLALVASKSKLSPKTQLSVPRLELMAAVLAARYAQYIKTSLKTENAPKVTLWTDSKCVLCWLRTTKILPDVVQKVITEIKSYQLSSHNYVPTDKNPADIVSRGGDYATLKDMEWWQGPTWLRDENLWPLQEKFNEKAAENWALKLNKEEKILLTRTNVIVKKVSLPEYSVAPFNLDPKKFRTFEALLKRSAYVLRAVNSIFMNRIQKKVIPVPDERTDFNYVRTIWLKWDQTRAYEEIAVQKKSNVAYLRNISIFKDDNGLLRCATRLQKSGQDYETIYPILLVKDSPLTTLIVISTHLNNLHAGTSHTLAALRRMYWLPQGRQQVYKIIKRICSTCKQHAAKPFALPEMAPLPEFRIKETETPFRNTGVDTFGPIEVKIPGATKQQRKRWVIIFTCMIVRAVHLEILEEMTSEEFLMAFRRYIARRGTPEIVVSDNAPQFHVIDRKFVSLWHHISEKEDVVDYFAKKQIKWKFIPPHSPWMGGVYERLIKSIKTALEKTNPTLLTPKQLTTIMTEIEAMMNSRPISYVDKSIETPIITPNHFLSSRYPAIPVDFEKENQEEISQLWKAAEQILETYWRKWSEYYVLFLRDRVDDMKNPKLAEYRTPKVGEVVLMANPMKKRSLWTKAIVERLIPSQDGAIRSVQIKMPNRARLIRPINKLLSLDLITDLPDAQRLQLNEAKTALVLRPSESVEDENLASTSRGVRRNRIPERKAASSNEESVSSKKPLEKFLES